jgi:hypothetical protein
MSVRIIYRSNTEIQNAECALYFECFHYSRPPLWSSGQSFWLQIRRSRVQFPALPHFSLEVVSLERGPLSLARITEELLEWKGREAPSL